MEVKSEFKCDIETLSNTLAGELDATHRSATDNFSALQSRVGTLNEQLQDQLAKSRNGSENNSLSVPVLPHLDPDESKSLPRFANTDNLSEEDASLPAQSEGPKLGRLLMILS